MSEDLRFAGIARLYGQQAFNKFQAAHVCVVGIGGVGSWAVEALARSAIGEITMIDLDDICVSNTNRQIHALEGQYGKNKCKAMEQRIKAINPAVKVNNINAFVTSSNVNTISDWKFDCVIDAIDDLPAKAALLHHLKRNKVKVVSVGAAGGRQDPMQITMADLAQTEVDSFLSLLRKRLRREYGFSKNPKRRFSIPCVYSTEAPWFPDCDGKVSRTKPAKGSSGRLDCAHSLGAATAVTASFALTATAHCLKIIQRSKTS
ncbi:MAG: tRNA threonylcarbamoyladenosine dehydratase [bacterium]